MVYLPTSRRKRSIPCVLHVTRFTLPDGVPQFNCLISAATHDLSVVRGEGHAQYVFLVAHELSRACADGQIPQTQRTVPRRADSEETITRDDDIGNEVRVSAQGFARHAARGAFARWIVLVVQLPDDDRLVARGGNDHIGKLGCCCDLCYPVIVTDENTFQGDVFVRHFLLLVFYEVFSQQEMTESSVSLEEIRRS